MSKTHIKGKIKDLRAFIARVPKSDLHVHLDGSIRPSTIIEIAKREKIKLPSYTESGFNKIVLKDHYRNLEEYLKFFQYGVAVMQNPENLEKIAYELVNDNIAEGVRYIEVRFAPQQHINSKMDLLEVLSAVNRGLEKAKKEFNNSPKVKKELEPRFNYGIIVCALRYFGRWSDYFNRFLDAHPFSKEKRVFALASYELVQGVIKIRNETGMPIVGFDLAGREEGYPADDHWKAYQFAHKNFLHKTVHAGEAYGPESIFQAITDLHAERIGHGHYLFDHTKVYSPDIKDKKLYVKELAQFVADRRITIEVCLTSNMQTNPAIKNIKNHQFKKMKDANLSTTICTDNRTVSKTSVSKEIELAVTTFGIQTSELKDILTYGFKRSFYPGDYKEKRKYVRSIIDYYEKIEDQFVS